MPRLGDGERHVQVGGEVRAEEVKIAPEPEEKEDISSCTMSGGSAPSRPGIRTRARRTTFSPKVTVAADARDRVSQGRWRVLFFLLSFVAICRQRGAGPLVADTAERTTARAGRAARPRRITANLSRRRHDEAQRRSHRCGLGDSGVDSVISRWTAVAVALDIDVNDVAAAAVVLDADGLDDDRFLRQFDGRELRQGIEQLLRRRVVAQFYFGVRIKGLPPAGTTHTPPWTKPSPTKLPFVPSERLMFFLRREKG